MRSVRSVVRSLIAVLLALSCVALVAATVQASVQGSRVQRQSARTNAAVSHSPTISITGVSPQFARSTTKTVTVSGTLTNHTGSAISGIQVQLQWYPMPFGTPSNMSTFAAGGPAVLAEGQFSLQPVGNPYPLPHALANGATTHWTVSFQLLQAFAASGEPAGFGDYPLRALASSPASADLASSQTFLPYWPGGNPAPATPLKIAWIWPLIDTPQQGACPQTLATNSLAGQLSANGRLSTLVNEGLQYASADDLTWAVDPALLSDATVMTAPHYFTGGNAECSGRNQLPADPAAKTWLSKLAGTAGDSAFLTPYADVDVAALSHNGLEADLRSAYQVGDTVAAKILPGTFGPSATANGTTLATAWPADGTADAGVLTSLARDGGVSTVVLNSNELPSSMAINGTAYDTAVARTKTSAGSSMSVLRADSDITSVLGSASAASSAGAQFAAEQDFLAQTAMIVAEGPNTPVRSLVVAPPAGWDPSSAEATDLLRLTSNAPWLSPTGLGTLAAETAKLPAERLPAREVSGDGLSATYMGELQSLDTTMKLFEGILSQPPTSYLDSLAAAAAVTESSAWRGRGSPRGLLAIGELSSYLQDLQRTVLLIPVKKILLAGTSGDTPVSVQNGLNKPYLPDLPISVRVQASEPPGGTLQVTEPALPLVVHPGMTGTVRLHLHSATTVGTTTMQLQLTTSNGSPLTWKGASEPLSVEVTRFGRTILVIIFGALGVLVLATVVRLRRKRRGRGRHGGERGAGTDDDASSKADSRAHAGGAG
jgi:Family of unknown function (DUF6049)